MVCTLPSRSSQKLQILFSKNIFSRGEKIGNSLKDIPDPSTTFSLLVTCS
uniref:Uncharacterized protein n=1 Tax=Arundo donax TaxID=35708 RepID=A0A0A9GUG0_ARUDO